MMSLILMRLLFLLPLLLMFLFQVLLLVMFVFLFLFPVLVLFLSRAARSDRNRAGLFFLLSNLLGGIA